MTKISAPIAASFLVAMSFATLLTAQTASPAPGDAVQPPSSSATSLASESAPVPGVSKVRIVRLSEIRGSVLLDRNIGRGFEPAIANLPIVEQNRLQTGVGAAEIEFEDNSTLRVAPESVVEFPQLSRLASGSTVSSVRILKGMAYVSMVKAKGNNQFNLLFGDQKLQLVPGTHVRLQLNPTLATLAVLDGALHVDSPSGPIDVQKKKSVTFAMAQPSEPTVAKGFESDPFDTWDHESAEYHARVAAFGPMGNSSYSYGLSDMMYYGSFADVAGCGNMWRPYFTSAAWDPYANGTWAWYGGAGYSWVSPYPWGWTPFHSGSWAFCPNSGWGWMPGGGWNGLNNTSVLNNNSGGGTMLRYHPGPPRPPRIGQASLQPVSTAPIVRSGVASQNTFVFRKDSAGLGIPRTGLGSLNKLSVHAVLKGSTSTPIYMNVQNSGANGSRASNNSVSAVSIRRGSPPPSSGAYSNDSNGFSSLNGGGSARSTASAPVSSPARSAGPRR